MKKKPQIRIIYQNCRNFHYIPDGQICLTNIKSTRFKWVFFIVLGMYNFGTRLAGICWKIILIPNIRNMVRRNTCVPCVEKALYSKKHVDYTKENMKSSPVMFVVDNSILVLQWEIIWVQFTNLKQKRMFVNYVVFRLSCKRNLGCTWEKSIILKV